MAASSARRRRSLLDGSKSGSQRLGIHHHRVPGMKTFQPLVFQAFGFGFLIHAGDLNLGFFESFYPGRFPFVQANDVVKAA